jgi:ubiquinone/menaquinone biosynthesis C-methylase UbiE
LERILEPEAMDTAEEAEGYDSMDHKVPNANFVSRLFELGAKGRMLDLGTGPAHMPIMICGLREEVTVVGLDLAENMLRLAATNVERSGFGERIELVLGDAKDVELESQSFDAVFSNTILHHIPDPRPFLREALRLLKPGGVLFIRDLYRPESVERIDELVEMHSGDANDYQRALFGASLNAAFTQNELRGIADECGLQHAEIVIDSDRHMSLQIRAMA